MNQSLPKWLKGFIVLLAFLNIITFLIVFNVSNLEGMHYDNNLISVETGIKSTIWANSFVLSLIIILGSIFYNLKSLSDNHRFHTILRSVIIILSAFLIYSMSFVIPFQENITINKSTNYLIIKRHFVLRGLLKDEIKFADIDYIKYTIQYYAVRNPAVQNYITLISLVLTNGREIQVSASSQDINSVSLREKMVKDIAQASNKKIVTVQQKPF